MTMKDLLQSMAWLVVVGLTAVGCAANKPVTGDLPPPVPREFRAVWVATVANIDWPSKPGLSTADQQAEAIAILDKCASLNINAVVFQVRPGCDAMYASKLEPWSYYLTGEQGKPPAPFYDPLAFWIEESHKRGIELHAWFNPYRARHSGAKDIPQSSSHISKTNPSIVKEFKGWQWLDPAEPAAQDLSFDVFMDVVKRYNVDGIHIDDYFYPYPDYFTVDGKKGDFPDDNSWERYQQAGGKMSRDDWRRHNVDVLIERIYKGAKKLKKHVQFGISPFGQPNKRYAPPGVDVKFSQYDILYADAEKWLHNGWLDYWTPQLYWPIAQKGQAFGDLVDYWKTQNKKERHFWPGLYTSRLAPRAAGENSPTTASTQPAPNPDEIVDQIKLTREKGVDGHVHFSMKPILNNQRLAEQLSELYAVPALIPSTPWIDGKAPGKPSVRLGVKDGRATLTIRKGSRERPYRWAVWKRFGSEWVLEIFPGGDSTRSEFDAVRNGQPLNAVCVSAVDRGGNESVRVTSIVQQAD